MTNKQKVLKLLESYRDMTLSFGCEVESKAYHGGWIKYKAREEYVTLETLCGCKGNSLTTQGFVSYKCGLCRKGKTWHNGMPPKWCPSCSKERIVCGYCKRKYKILGHPPTLSTLLIALERIESKAGSDMFWSIDMWGNLETMQTSEDIRIKIPLTTPLTDIPEDDQMWEQLLTILK